MVRRDSTGNVILVGDRVLFRGKEFTIKSFLDGAGRYATAGIEFEEVLHTFELPDEISVDLVFSKNKEV